MAARYFLDNLNSRGRTGFEIYTQQRCDAFMGGYAGWAEVRRIDRKQKR